MEIPIQLAAAAFAAILAGLGWVIRLLYRLGDRMAAVEYCLEFNGLKLPTRRE